VFEMSGQARAGSRGNPRGRPPNSKKQTTIPSYFLQSAGAVLRLPQDQLTEVEWPANVQALLTADPRSDRPTATDGDKPPSLSTSEVNLRQTFWKSLAKWFDNQLFVAPAASAGGVPAYTLDQWRTVLRSARSIRGKRETRAANHEKLVRGFPEIWQASQKKEQNPTEKSIKNKESKLRAVLRTGSQQYMEHHNISELYPGLPLFNGCMVDNLPLPMMSHLVHHYGSLDYQHKFQKNAKFINVSMTDRTLLEEFGPDTDGTFRPAPVCVCKKKKGAKCACGFQGVLEVAKFQSEGLVFDSAAKEVRDAEFGFSATGKTAARKPAPTAEQREASMNEFYEEHRNIWTGKSLKQYGQDHLKMSMADQKNSRAMSCNYLNLEGTWSRAPRAQYLMDFWGAPDKNGLKADEVEPTNLGFNAPLDSTFFPGEAHAAGPSMCQFLARAALEEVFGNYSPKHYDKTAEEFIGQLGEDTTQTEKLPNTAPRNAWGTGLLE
jgi:hypothetical protein